MLCSVDAIIPAIIPPNTERLSVNIPSVVVTYELYSAGILSGVNTPNGVTPKDNIVETAVFIIKKPTAPARPAVPLSDLANPTAIPIANNNGKLSNTAPPTFCITVNIAVTASILTKLIRP